MSSAESDGIKHNALSGVRYLLGLESVGLTAAFWAAVGLVAAAFVTCKYPPMIDYPQHIAMGAVIGRLLGSSPVEAPYYDINFFTYNAGVETFVALLSQVMAPDLAGRLILGLHVVLWAVGALLLCKLSGRPRWYAFLAIPLIYNFVCGWGFANFVFATPIVLIVTAGWIRIIDGARKWWLLAGVGCLSMLVAFSHVLAMLSLCVVVTVLSVERLWAKLPEPGMDFVGRVKSLVVPGAVLVPSVTYCLGAWFYARKISTDPWEHKWAEGQDDPLWQKLWSLLYNATGNFGDQSDQRLLLAGIAVGVGIAIWADQAGFEPRMKRLALAFAVLYAVVPKVFIATFHIYIRFLPFAAMFAIAALPVMRGPRARWWTVATAAVGILTSLNVFSKFRSIPEVDDLIAITNDAPAGRKLMPLTWDPTPPGYLREIWVHGFAMYQVRKPGFLAYSFTRNESPPLHFKPGMEPPHPPGGFEWNASVYNPLQDYARYYDLVLVRTWVDKTTGQAVDPTSYTFKSMVPYVKLLSRRGRFYLYDTSALTRAKPWVPVDDLPDVPE